MTDGLVLAAGDGRKLPAPGMTLKFGADRSKRWSVFQVEVPPGFDVGAHLHREAEELFYVLEGELELLAFEPRIRAKTDWRTWESETGTKAVRGRTGSTMFVPAGCPHAFTNPGTATARMLFLVSPSGHERYQDELGELLGKQGPPDQAAIQKLRARYDIEQITPLIPGRPSGPPGRPPV